MRLPTLPGAVADFGTHSLRRFVEIEGAQQATVLGAQAFTSGLVNFMPNTVLDVWRLGSTGNTVALESLIAEKIRSLAKLREKRKGYSVAVIKEAMSMLEYCNNTLRSPLMPLLDEDRDHLQQILFDLGILTEPDEVS